MRRTLLGLLTALALVLTLGLSSARASDTNPTNNPTWTTTTSCVPYRSISTCAYISWHRQADDNGIVVESITVWTPTGCGDLEGGAPAHQAQYGDVTVAMMGPQLGETRSHFYNYGDEACDIQHYPMWAGYDDGSMRFHLHLHARVDVAGDKNVDFEWRVGDQGGQTLITHEATDCPC